MKAIPCILQNCKFIFYLSFCTYLNLNCVTSRWLEINTRPSFLNMLSNCYILDVSSAIVKFGIWFDRNQLLTGTQRKLLAAVTSKTTNLW